MNSDTPAPVRGRPILGAFAGLLLGIGISLDLLMFGVIPLESVLVVAIPPASLLLGGVIGALHPLGRGGG
jgi:hypothetical protein